MQDNAPPIPPVLRALREGTREAHDAVERLPAMAALMGPAVTPSEYVTALAGLFAFHATLRGALRQAVAAFRLSLDVPEAPVRALAADLTWFGVPASLAGAPPMAPLVTEAAVHGARYVLEGSALGARVIARHVAPRLGVAAGEGGSFFCGVSAEAARRTWASLCEDVSVLEAAASAEALQGATAAFAHFAACLSIPSVTIPERAATGGAGIGRARRAPALVH